MLIHNCLLPVRALGSIKQIGISLGHLPLLQEQVTSIHIFIVYSPLNFGLNQSGCQCNCSNTVLYFS